MDNMMGKSNSNMTDSTYIVWLALALVYLPTRWTWKACWLRERYNIKVVETLWTDGPVTEVTEDQVTTILTHDTELWRLSDTAATAECRHTGSWVQSSDGGGIWGYSTSICWLTFILISPQCRRVISHLICNTSISGQLNGPSRLQRTAESMHYHSPLC